MLDAADVMDNDNFVTVLEGFIILSSLSVAQANTKKLPPLDYLVLAKKWDILTKNALNKIYCTT